MISKTKPREIRDWRAIRYNRPECRGYRAPAPHSDYTLHISEDASGQQHYEIGIGEGEYWGGLKTLPSLSEALAYFAAESARDMAVSHG